MKRERENSDSRKRDRLINYKTPPICDLEPVVERDRFRSYRSDATADSVATSLLRETRGDRYRFVKALTIVLRCPINTGHSINAYRTESECQ